MKETNRSLGKQRSRETFIEMFSMYVSSLSWDNQSRAEVIVSRQKNATQQMLQGRKIDFTTAFTR